VILKPIVAAELFAAIEAVLEASEESEIAQGQTPARA
jgi:hypothetical protein